MSPTTWPKRRGHPVAVVATVLILVFAVLASRSLRSDPPPGEDPEGTASSSKSFTSAAAQAEGRMEIKVTDGPDGSVVPVMVSPRHVGDGQYYQPDKALDLTGQWDKQGTPGPRRKPNIGGPLSVPSWCSEGPISLDGKAGSWEVLIRRGLEYVPHTEKVEVAAGKTARSHVSLRRWVNMPKRGWWSGDDHVHAQILSDQDAQRILTWARAEDTHVINVVKMGDIYRTWFEQRGWGPKHRFIAEDYSLVPGQECPRTHQELGHTLALNLSSNMVRDTSQYFLYDYQFDRTRKQGGLVGYAHVNSGAFFVHRDMTINVAKGKVDFVELLQFGRSDPGLFYEFLNLGMRLTALAGSDVPWGGSIGEARAYAYTGQEKLSADAWYDAVRRARTFVSNGPMLDLRVQDAYPGDTIKAGRGQKLRVKARAWGHPRVGPPRLLEIVRLGEVIRSASAAHPPAEDQAGAQLELDFSIDAGDGFWLAARTRAFDGSLAHTSPLWVERQGLRPWKHEAVETLIAKRLDSLRSIEDLYQKRKDQAKDSFIVQWPQLEQRIAAARKIYEDLRLVADREKPLRR